MVFYQKGWKHTRNSVFQYQSASCSQIPAMNSKTKNIYSIYLCNPADIEILNQ